MADDQIVQNAQATAATPANNPPAPVEDKQAAEAAMTPGQRRVAELNKASDDGIYSKDPTRQKAAMAELRALLAAQETPDEQAARADLTVAERREQYGVQPPSLPKPWADEYASDFASWEVPLYDVAHEHGLAAEQVCGLRDAAVDLGQVVGDTGRPASEEDLTRIFDRYRVSPSARPALVALWKRIEGTAS
jgi:hypothetical protein